MGDLSGEGGGTLSPNSYKLSQKKLYCKGEPYWFSSKRYHSVQTDTQTNSYTFFYFYIKILIIEKCLGKPWSWEWRWGWHRPRVRHGQDGLPPAKWSICALQQRFVRWRTVYRYVLYWRRYSIIRNFRPFVSLSEMLISLLLFQVDNWNLLCKFFALVWLKKV